MNVWLIVLYSSLIGLKLNIQMIDMLQNEQLRRKRILEITLFFFFMPLYIIWTYIGAIWFQNVYHNQMECKYKQIAAVLLFWIIISFFILLTFALILISYIVLMVSLLYN